MTNTWRIVKKEQISGGSIIVKTKDADGNLIDPPGATIHFAIQDWAWAGVDLHPGDKGLGVCEYPINAAHRAGVHTVVVVQPGAESETAYLPVPTGGWKVVFQLEEAEEPPTPPPPPPPPPPGPEPEPEPEELAAFIAGLQKSHYYHCRAANFAADAAWRGIIAANEDAALLERYGHPVRRDFLDPWTLVTLSNFPQPDDDEPGG